LAFPFCIVLTTSPILQRHMIETWGIGIILIIFGALSSAIGLLLMKNSADTEKDLPLLQRRRWMLGFIFLVVNATLIDLVAYGMTPLALIAPFAGLTIIFSTLLALSGWLSQKEQVDTRQWVSIAVIVAGVTCVSSAGPHSSQDVTEENIGIHLLSEPFVIFACSSILGVVVSVIYWAFQDLWKLDHLRQSKAVVFLLAFGAASSGALSQLCLKEVSSALHSALQGQTFLQPHVLAVILGLLAFAPLQLVLLNSTLINSPVVFAVPLYESLLIIWTITAGGTFFGEFNQMPPEHLIIFCTGVLASILGLCILSANTHSCSQEEQKMLIQKERAGAGQLMDQVRNNL